MPDLKIYRVFLSSPAEMAEERVRVRDEIDRLNVVLRRPGILLELIRWETHTAPALGVDAMDAVNQQVDAAACEIFLGIMGKRLGTKTARADSGTVEEFEAAYKRWQAHGVPRIMFYFNRSRVVPELEELPELGRALRFRESVSKRGLVAEYDDIWQFSHLILSQLMLAVEQLGERAQNRSAAELTPPEDTDPDSDPDPLPPPPSPELDELDGEWVLPFVDVVDLRFRLEAKLTWLCKHLLAGPDTPTFATIGSLRHDRYLTDDQARVATRILERTPESIAAEQPEDLARTLEVDTTFVNGFRASVLDGFVRARVRKIGWDVVDFAQAPGHRADFFAERESRPRTRVSPRFVFGDDSKILARTIERLRGQLDDEPDEVGRRMIVVPDRGVIATDLKASPQIVRYEDLGRALAG